MGEKYIFSYQFNYQIILYSFDSKKYNKEPSQVYLCIFHMLISIPIQECLVFSLEKTQCRVLLTTMSFSSIYRYGWKYNLRGPVRLSVLLTSTYRYQTQRLNRKLMINLIGQKVYNTSMLVAKKNNSHEYAIGTVKK